MTTTRLESKRTRGVGSVRMDLRNFLKAKKRSSANGGQSSLMSTWELSQMKQSDLEVMILVAMYEDPKGTINSVRWPLVRAEWFKTEVYDVGQELSKIDFNDNWQREPGFEIYYQAFAKRGVCFGDLGDFGNLFLVLPSFARIWIKELERRFIESQIAGGMDGRKLLPNRS